MYNIEFSSCFSPFSLHLVSGTLFQVIFFCLVSFLYFTYSSFLPFFRVVLTLFSEQVIVKYYSISLVPVFVL